MRRGLDGAGLLRNARLLDRATDETPDPPEARAYRSQAAVDRETAAAMLGACTARAARRLATDRWCPRCRSWYFERPRKA